MGGVHGRINVRVGIEGLDLLLAPQRFGTRVLILHGSRRVAPLEIHVRSVVRGPVARLVAGRPRDNAWVVLIALKHASHTVEMRRFPLLLRRERLGEKGWIISVVGFKFNFNLILIC